ncbi:MAG TPA: glycoside hydrolase family 3 N-terminal domain-containing protein, partial [Polyangia bacterium]
MRTSSLQISTLFVLTTVAACSGSSGNPGGSGEGGAGGEFGGQGYDGGGIGGWAAVGIDGGAWAPSTTCIDRASALVEAMTPAQRYGQMMTVDSNGLTVVEATTQLLGSVFSGGGSDPTSGNRITDWTSLVSSYLNITRGYNPQTGLLYGIDAIHGNNNVQDSVIFPHHIGLGASRNAALVEQIGRITAVEMLGAGINWAFAPTVAAARDIRWGRTYEAFGETPDLAGELGAAEVRGLQNGRLGSPQSVLAAAKHYAGDGDTEGGKNAGNVTTLDEGTFRELAIEPYLPSIAAGVGSIMVSYSSYQGVKMTASKQWLTDVLKGELGFQGFLVSDWDAVSQLPGSWNEQVKSAINAGLDMVMLSHSKGAHTAADLAKALSSLVASGDIPEGRIEDAVRRILTIKCEMGLLDGDTTIDPELT